MKVQEHEQQTAELHSLQNNFLQAQTTITNLLNTVQIKQQTSNQQTLVIHQLELDNAALQSQFDDVHASLIACQSQIVKLAHDLEEHTQQNPQVVLAMTDDGQSDDARNMRNMHRQLTVTEQTCDGLRKQVEVLEAERATLLNELGELKVHHRRLQQNKSIRAARADEKEADAVEKARREVYSVPRDEDLPVFDSMQTWKNHRMYNSLMRRTMAKLFEHGVPACKTGTVIQLVLQQLRIGQLSSVPSPATGGYI